MDSYYERVSDIFFVTQIFSYLWAIIVLEYSFIRGTEMIPI